MMMNKKIMMMSTKVVWGDETAETDGGVVASSFPDIDKKAQMVTDGNTQKYCSIRSSLTLLFSRWWIDKLLNCN